MSRHARPACGQGWREVPHPCLRRSSWSGPTSPTPSTPLLSAPPSAWQHWLPRDSRSCRPARNASTQARFEELDEAQRRDAWRVRSELDEAHARSQRALQRAIAAESAVQTLMAATESLLAVRHALDSLPPSRSSGSAGPATPPVWIPPAALLRRSRSRSTVLPRGRTPMPAPGAPPPCRPQEPIFAPAAAFMPVPATYAPAAALADTLTPPTLVWPLADLPEPRRPSLDLPLIPAPVARVSPLFAPVEAPAQRGTTPSTSTSGAEPRAASELVDITSTSTQRFARPA